MFNREDQKLQVQQATDVVALIGEHIALRPRGKEFLGLCPFHDDKNPSLHVSPAKQIYKCFSCGAGGDVFSFLMNYHKMTFPEALRHLADRAGIKLQSTSTYQATSDDGAEGTDRQRITGANEQAVAFYRSVLRHAEHGRVARHYLQQRRISDDMVQAFQIGCAPDLWDGLVRMIASRGWDAHAFELAGLIAKRDGAEGSFDRLRHRLIFPICDSLGRPIAFGGRVLPGSTRDDKADAKYLNSPETLVFNKSATLYGLHLAKKTIIESRTAVIVEGYTDVIACHQAGVRNVVATLGTALTAQHAAQLRRYAEKVVLIFDADEAGQKAADRAVEVFLTETLDVTVAVLPDGLDPADLLAQPEGLQRWTHALEHATDALGYQLDRLRAQVEGSDTITGRQRLAEQYLRQVAGLGLNRTGTLRRGLVIARLAELLHLGESVVEKMLKQLTPAPRTEAPARPDKNMADNPDADVAPATGGTMIKALALAGRQVIGCLLQRPDLFHATLADGRTLDEALTPDQLVGDTEQRLYQRVHDLLSRESALTLTHLLAELAAAGEQDLTGLATDAHGMVEEATDKRDEAVERMLLDSAGRILAHHREAQYRQHRQQPLAEQPDHAQLRMIEHLRTNPSPLRIARVTR